MSADAIRELEVEVSGFYLGGPPDNPKPAAPDEVRTYPLLRLYTGEVMAQIDLTTIDAGILSRQLGWGRELPGQAAALARTVQEIRGAR